MRVRAKKRAPPLPASRCWELADVPRCSSSTGGIAPVVSRSKVAGGLPEARIDTQRNDVIHRVGTRLATQPADVRSLEHSSSHLLEVVRAPTVISLVHCQLRWWVVPWEGTAIPCAEMQKAPVLCTRRLWNQMIPWHNAIHNS